MATQKIAKLPQKTPIFAYLRRSTGKEEQRESLIQQEDGIDSIVKRLGFDKEDIKYFAETYSGFENKTRKQWGELIKEIDKLEKPCIILTRDLSRLSRNPTDTQTIMDRLYGDNKRKRLIEKIIYLDYEVTKEVSKETDKEILHKMFSSGYYDSLDTRRKSIGGIILKLEKGEFPYTAPKGLDNFVYRGQRILKQNDKMPFIKRAFELKIGGKTHKEISKYLKRQGSIKMGDRELSDRIFKNTVYIGEYTEKNTGLHFKNLKFFEGKPPIPLTLWDQVQKCFGKKISQYGAGQKDHLLGAKIKSESGHLFSRYLAKGIYPTYKGKYKSGSGSKNIHISEKNILEGFVKKIREVVRIYHDRNYARLVEELKHPEILKNALDEIKKEIPCKNWYTELSEDDKAIVDKAIGKMVDDFFEADLTQDLTDLAVLDLSTDIKKGSLFLENHKKESLDDEKHVNKLQKEKETLEQELIQFTRNASKQGYDIELVKKTLQEIENDIQRVNNQILELSAESGMEKYLGRLPEILSHIVELASNTFQYQEINSMIEDLKILLELTTVELTISNKKELKIKLFEVLEGLFSSDMSILEAPSGVEPDYRALQAPA